MAGDSELGFLKDAGVRENGESPRRSQKPKQSMNSDVKTSSVSKTRDALYEYIKDPESFMPVRVVYYNADFVVIRDLFPKSTVHLLLLPRDFNKTRIHPFEAFEDPDFLAKVQAEVKSLRKLVAAELRRMYGKHSSLDKVREEAMEADPPPDELPKGRDWESEVMCGIHAHPSMNNLHVHVLSVDRHSPCLKHRKHYNSFSTPFLIDIDDFPLAPDDARRHPGKAGYMQRDLKCWRCGHNSGGRFTQLKAHLEEEFEKWKHI